VNLTISIPDNTLEVSINGERYALVRRSALDALYPGGSGGNYTARNPATRTTGDRSHERYPTRTVPVKTSRPAPKKKAPPPPNPAARPAAPPNPDASELVDGTMRAAIFAEVQKNPGRTSIETFEVLRKRVTNTSSGSVYQSLKALVRKGLVEGRPDEIGRMCWHPKRSARPPASGATITPRGPNSPIPENAPPEGSRAPGAARAGAAV